MTPREAARRAVEALYAVKLASSTAWRDARINSTKNWGGDARLRAFGDRQLARVRAANSRMMATSLRGTDDDLQHLIDTSNKAREAWATARARPASVATPLPRPALRTPGVLASLLPKTPSGKALALGGLGVGTALGAYGLYRALRPKPPTDDTTKTAGLDRHLLTR